MWPEDLTEDGVRAAVPLGSIWQQGPLDIYVVIGYRFDDPLGFDVDLRHIAHGYRDMMTSYGMLMGWQRLYDHEESAEVVAEELLRLYKELN